MYQTFLILGICSLIVASAQLCFKKGVLVLGNLDFSFSGILHLIPRIFQSGYLMGGIFLFGISFLLWLFILSKLQLNVAYPIALSCEVTLVTIATWFLFKEYLSLFQILGIVFIMVGIFLLATKG